MMFILLSSKQQTNYTTCMLSHQNDRCMVAPRSLCIMLGSLYTLQVLDVSIIYGSLASESEGISTIHVGRAEAEYKSATSVCG